MELDLLGNSSFFSCGWKSVLPTSNITTTPQMPITNWLGVWLGLRSDSDELGKHLSRGNGARCCKSCTSMTGTERGITSLGSAEGYAHLDIHGCWRGAEEGCELCNIVFHSGWEKYNAKITHQVATSEASRASFFNNRNKHARLHFFAEPLQSESEDARASFRQSTHCRGVKGWERLVGKLYVETAQGQRFWATVIELAVLASYGEPKTRSTDNASD
jgi:hypothetical protein